MKKIVLFNHKGGVSKTTSTFNLGWMIAEMGYKVLLVDADPQCNLTALFLGNEFDEYYENPQTREQNIKDGVKNAFTGAPRPIDAITCKSAPRNPNLYLLAGHMNLSEYEANLTFAFTASQAMMTLQSLPGAFNDLIEKTARSIDIDYVFIDLNPGLSTINQDLFLISDAFIIPTNPDTFSLMAIKSLSIILPRWVDWKNNHISEYEHSAYPLPAGTPKFIGSLPQRFNIRNGIPTKPFRVKIDELQHIIDIILMPALQNAGMLFTPAQYSNAGISGDCKLSEIKDFQGLAPKSLGVNVPVFALTDQELETNGAALEAQRSNRQAFYNIYADIANMIIKVLS